MRWDRLFDDLESQLEHELGAERVDVIAEEERLRLGRLAFRDRIIAMTGTGSSRRGLELVLRDGTPLRVEVETAGRDWIAGRLAAAPSSGAGRAASCLVPIEAIGAVAPAGTQLADGLGAEAVGAQAEALAARLGLAFVLRDLCRRRLPLDVICAWGRMHGTVDRVGRDHLDLAEHDPDVPRRAGAVRRIRLIPFAQLLWLRF